MENPAVLYLNSKYKDKYKLCRMLYQSEVYAMTSETQQIQAVYSSSDIAVTLKIQESTVRKYCLILEKSGYEFLKNENGHRAYFDADIIILKKFLELKKGTDMTLEQAAKSVVSWKNGIDIAGHDTEENRYIMRYDDLLKEFVAFKNSQEEFNRELLSQLQRQQEYINNKLESRDEKLMLALRETMETQKQLALTVELEKKKWWKFWAKGDR